MASAQRRPRVTVSAQPLWRIRLARELPRYAVYAVASAGVLASARFAIAPPRPVVPAAALRAPAPPDLAAEGFAALFARRYLTWDARDPEAHRQALVPFLAAGGEAEVGMQLPQSGEQRVEWDEVVQERSPQPGVHVYTVAAQTDTAGLLYLTVSVARGPGGLALAGFPAFVGPPATEPASVSTGTGPAVEEPALATVVRRALRNYLAASPSELDADLTGAARVSPPALTLSLLSLQRLSWAPGGGAVLAVLTAQDERGAQYTLGYELDVSRTAGRWEISAIQMDPDT